MDIMFVSDERSIVSDERARQFVFDLVEFVTDAWADDPDVPRDFVVARMVLAARVLLLRDKHGEVDEDAFESCVVTAVAEQPNLCKISS